MTRARAFAKINLALVVGPVRPDGNHEVATVLQAVDLWDDIELTSAEGLVVAGFPEDTLVRQALEGLAEAAGVVPTGTYGSRSGSPSPQVSAEAARMPLPRSSWRIRLSLCLSHARSCTHLLPRSGRTCRSSSARGRNSAPVTGPICRRSNSPRTTSCCLLGLKAPSKGSTASVYRRFDERDGAAGFDERRSELLRSAGAREGRPGPREAPQNDLASSPLRQELEALGAFRADVSGAGPVVYGLFDD